MISRNFSSTDLSFVFANKIGNGSLNSIRGPHYTAIKTSVFTKRDSTSFSIENIKIGSDPKQKLPSTNCSI